MVVRRRSEPKTYRRVPRFEPLFLFSTRLGLPRFALDTPQTNRLVVFQLKSEGLDPANGREAGKARLIPAAGCLSDVGVCPAMGLRCKCERDRGIDVQGCRVEHGEARQVLLAEEQADLRATENDAFRALRPKRVDHSQVLCP